MDTYTEGINMMWEEVEPSHKQQHQIPENTYVGPPETVIFHGTLTQDLESLCGGRFALYKKGKEFFFAYVKTKKVSKTKTKKQRTILSESLSCDIENPDVKSGAEIISYKIDGDVIALEVLTRTGAYARSEKRRKENAKKSFRKTLERMIKNAEKGPSGFWIDEDGGCGNPDIFPVFRDALQKGKYVQKHHDICPWNTSVMYGEGHGNAHTGCAHSCSIRNARYLSGDMIRDILTRFLARYDAGEYEKKEHLSPLLLPKEIAFINDAIKTEEEERTRRWKEEKEERLRKAAGLIAQYPEEEDWKDLLADYYGEDRTVQCNYGIIDFNPESVNEIANGDSITYDEYLLIMKNSYQSLRHGFERCFYGSVWISFKGRVENIRKGKICFERIYINGFYSDGEGFEDKEDHVWMDLKGFEDLKVGDSVSFAADVYRYLKTGHGKKIDFGLRNPEEITKINSYSLPSDDDLMKQAIDRLICDNMCLFRDHCYLGLCIANQEWLQDTRKQLYSAMKKQS